MDEREERHLTLIQGLRAREMEREQLIQQLMVIKSSMNQLTVQFHELMVKATEAGVSATRLANALGQTEASVRMYRKRKGMTSEDR